MHNDVLEEFQGVRFSDQGVHEEAWDCLLDSDITFAGVGGGGGQVEGAGQQPRRTLKSVLEERVVVPFEKSIQNPSYGA